MTIDHELDLRDEIEGLRTALSSRAVIEQAKGMLMFIYQVDADSAFAILQRWSMQSHHKLRELAAAFVDIGVHGDRGPTSADGPHDAVRRALRDAGDAPLVQDIRILHEA